MTTAASPSALAVEESKLQARRKLRGGWRHGAEDEHEPSGVLPAGRRRRRQASSEQHLPQRRAGVVRRHEALALRLAASVPGVLCTGSVRRRGVRLERLRVHAARWQKR